MWKWSLSSQVMWNWFESDHFQVKDCFSNVKVITFKSNDVKMVWKWWLSCQIRWKWRESDDFHVKLGESDVKVITFKSNDVFLTLLPVVKMSWGEKSKKKRNVLTNFHHLVYFIRHTGHMVTTGCPNVQTLISSVQTLMSNVSTLISNVKNLYSNV